MTTCSCDYLWSKALVIATTYGPTPLWLRLLMVLHNCDCYYFWSSLVFASTCSCKYSWLWLLVVATTHFPEHLWLWLLVVVTTFGCDYSWYWSLVFATVCGCDYFCFRLKVVVTTHGPDHLWMRLGWTKRDCDYKWSPIIVAMTIAIKYLEILFLKSYNNPGLQIL